MKTKSFLFTMLLSLTLHAQIYNGENQAKVELADVLAEITPGTILIIGEMHGLKSIHDQQMTILQGLRNKGLKVSTGMEFFNYTDQNLIQKFRRQELTEDQFKTSINWSGTDFSLYGPQLLFGEYGFGINMPRSVTGQISKAGFSSLSPEQQALMPPNFQLGSDSYKKRFSETMGGHLPPEKLDNYFAAQSTWDETMAWQTMEFMKDHQDQVFVIVVGEFHVAYGGGLPDSLRRRGALNVKTISQIYTEGLSPEDIQSEISISPADGKRADYIFLSNP